MNIILAPNEIEKISLDELFENYTKNLLINKEIMYEFHKKLMKYLQGDNAIYLLRQLKSLKRGKVIKNNFGYKIKPTDNSPAWWIHYKLFNKEFSNINNFINSIPCHMFEIKLKETINSAGWHAAHIFNAKDYNTDYSNWGKEELIKRTVRNIHPCNYFFIPKLNWQENGKNEEVISYFYYKYKNIYSDIWNDFEKIVNDKNYEFNYGRGEINLNICLPKISDKKGKEDLEMDRNEPTITSTRLMFRSNVIEKLENDEYFRIEVRDKGIFRMTKGEFYNTFNNVVNSKSYSENGNYNYSVLPKKAMQYKL